MNEKTNASALQRLPNASAPERSPNATVSINTTTARKINEKNFVKMNEKTNASALQRSPNATASSTTAPVRKMNEKTNASALQRLPNATASSTTAPVRKMNEKNFMKISFSDMALHLQKNQSKNDYQRQRRSTSMQLLQILREVHRVPAGTALAASHAPLDLADFQHDQDLADTSSQQLEVIRLAMEPILEPEVFNDGNLMLMTSVLAMCDDTTMVAEARGVHREDRKTDRKDSPMPSDAECCSEISDGLWADYKDRKLTEYIIARRKHLDFVASSKRKIVGIVTTIATTTTRDVTAVQTDLRKIQHIIAEHKIAIASNKVGTWLHTTILMTRMVLTVIRSIQKGWTFLSATLV